MSHLDVNEIELTDDAVLRYSQQVRHKLVGEMIANGMPTDKGDRMVMLTALADMDRTALGNKKIGAKEKNTAATQLAAEIFTQLMGKLGDRSPFAVDAIEGEYREVPMLQAEALGPTEMSPGETEIGVADENYDAFMRRMEQGDTPSSAV